MPFIAKPDGEKKFGENTRVLSIRIPESQFETIREIVYDFINNFREDNPKKIETIQDSIEEIISMYLDVKEYVWKEKNITQNKYYSILFNHNEDLIVDLIDKFPIERKTPVKTLTEEKIEEKMRKEERLKTQSELNVTPLTPRYESPPLSRKKKKDIIGAPGSPGYEKRLDKLMKRTTKSKRKRDRRL